jgi:DNA excision repair protein ERCC-3
MSDPGSPASSIDYLDSDYSSEGEGDDNLYKPGGAGARKPAAKAAKVPQGNIQVVSAGGTKIRINTKGLQPFANADTGLGRGLILRDAVDLSDQDLKKDHAVRPLWVDELGNMYVVTWMPCSFASILEAFAVLAPKAQDFLIAISEPVSRLVLSVMPYTNS